MTQSPELVIVTPEATPQTHEAMPPVANHSAFVRALDKALAVQRPVVLAHIRSVRLRHPEATPAQLVRILERRYLLAVTGGGAAVGAAAVIPAVSTPVALALSGVETVGFLETTALFAQSVAEVHGIHVENPDRARLLVMTLMLGQEGAQLLGQFTQQATGKGPARSAFWGEIVTKTLPRNAVGPVLDRLQTVFIRHFGGAAGASFLGKAMPFGIGAAIGGTGNHILGRRVVASSRRAFGIAPMAFSAELAPKEGAKRIEHRVLAGVRTAGATVGAGVGAVARGTKRAVTSKKRKAKAELTASEPQQALPYSSAE
jgi:hypothetical protein